MVSFYIKKINNGEYKEIEKKFVLDTNRFRVKSDTLYFNVLGEENPVVFDLELFERIMMSQISQGFMESLEYKDGLIIATTRDGNTVKKYTYDFGWNRFKDSSLGNDSKEDNVEIEKHFVLDLDKYRGHGDTLSFKVEGEENPTVYDLGVFLSNMIGLIGDGLMQSLEFKDDLLITTINDGKTIKKYSYDFGWNRLNNGPFEMGTNSSFDELKSYILKIVSYYNENPNNVLEELKNAMYKVISFYNENPNREILSKQKNLRIIYDIMDGDRLPNIENRDDILRIFQVYHAYKAEILETLLDNVVFFNDEDGSVLDYGDFIRNRKLEMIKYEILTQMDLKMFMFANKNDAYDLYQEYNDNTNILPIEIEYKYVDQDGNEIEPEVEEVEAGTVFSVGRELVGKGISSLRNVASSGVGFVSSKASSIKDKVKEKIRTRK